MKRRIAADDGFTLVEVLVVTFIIGIIASIIMVNFTVEDIHKPKYFGQYFSRMIPVAQQQAILTPAEIGLLVNKDSIQFLQYDKSWQAIDVSFMAHSTLLLQGINLNLVIDGKVVDLNKKITNPQILFSADGEITPFKLSISAAGVDSYTITSSANGEINVNNE